jgi:hypothetical protein
MAGGGAASTVVLKKTSASKGANNIIGIFRQALNKR